MPRANCNSCKPVVLLNPVHVLQDDGTIVTYPGRPVLVGPTFTTSQAARVLGLNRATIARMCDEGRFRTAYKPAGSERAHWRIAQAEICERLAPSA